MIRTETSAVKGEIELGEGVRQRLEYQEHKRQANIISVAGRATQLLADEIVPAAEPDHDWTARFFREAQDVSSEEMQVLWSRVLAGQVREPGTTSMRTLGVLKDLDVSTARLFSRFCSAAVYLKDSNGQIFDARVPSLGGSAAQNSIAKFGLGFGQLNRLNEHGLIISDYNSYFDYLVLNDLHKSSELELLHQGISWDWVPAENNVQEQLVKLHGVAMTVSGSELSRVVTPLPFAEYTKALKAFLQTGFGIKMRRIEEVDSQQLDDAARIC